MSHRPTDEQRLTQWVDEHAQAVFGYVYARLRDRDRADDIVQETFARAWQARSRYESRGQERAYLLRIADRLTVDDFRRRLRETTLANETLQTISEPPDEVHLAADREAIASETNARLTAALGLLTEPQRRTLLLRHFGELTFEQIATELNCPLGTVLSHCRRGLAALRRILDGDEGSGNGAPRRLAAAAAAIPADAERMRK